MGVKVDITNGRLTLLEDIQYKDHIIKAGAESDGGTSKYFANILFSNKDYYQGTRAFFFHDHYSDNKNLYGRKWATQRLVDIWVEDGLDVWKSKIVKFAVNTYQWFKGWK